MGIVARRDTHISDRDMSSVGSPACRRVKGVRRAYDVLTTANQVKTTYQLLAESQALYPGYLDLYSRLNLEPSRSHCYARQRAFQTLRSLKSSLWLC